jgi:chitodextrinase
VPNFSAYSGIASATTPAAPDTQPPTAPSGLTVTAGTNQNLLSWTASTDNVGVTAYLIERCQGVSCSTFAQIDTSTITSYTDNTALALTSYSYRVRARDAVPNFSGYSNNGTATPADCD